MYEVKIDSSINILGSLKDWGLVHVFNEQALNNKELLSNYAVFTTIKTSNSIGRFEHVIKNTLLSFKSENLRLLFQSVFHEKGLSQESMIMLFWNTAANNELFSYLNDKIYFPALYSGRIAIKRDEVIACLRELRVHENDLKEWSDATITITASKYLTLLKKYGLMEGSVNKTIKHIWLSDELFIVFMYWLMEISNKSNLLDSSWLQYSFIEKQAFLDRLLQKRFSKYYHVSYTGDKLHIEPILPYEYIYEHIAQS